MLVKEIMTPGAQSITPDVSLKDAARTMDEMDVGILTIVERDQPVGVITDRDICCRGVAQGLDPMVTRVSELMSKDVFTCFSDQDISEVVTLMEDKHIRRLAVVNRDNKIEGMLSADDLARTNHELAGEVLASAQPMH